MSQTERTENGAEPVPVVMVALPPWSTTHPPIGVAILSNYLRSEGIDTSVVDFNIEIWHATPEDRRHIWEPNFQSHWHDMGKFSETIQMFDEVIDRCVDQVLSHDPSIVGVSICSPKQRFAIEVIRRIFERDPLVHIILGGVACSTAVERRIFLDWAGDCITGFVVGEGEETFLEVVRELLSSDPKLDQIESFLWTDEMDLTTELPAEKVRKPVDLNAIPFPTYAEFDLSKYSQRISMEMSRGCIGNCTYCAIKHLHKGLRVRTPENVFKEMTYHSEVNNTEVFTFVDSLINSRVKDLEALSDYLIEQGSTVPWSGDGIARKEMSYPLLEKMHRAGCVTLCYGVESGSNKILRAMRKIFTIEDAERVIKDTHRAGISVSLFLIVGYPGEGEEEFQETLDFLRRCHQSISLIQSINMIYMLYNTYIHDNHVELGIELPVTGDGHLWQQGDNTTELRMKRIEAVRQLAEALGIPNTINSNEEITRSASGQEVHIAKVLFTDDGGEQLSDLHVGMTVTVCIVFVVKDEVEDPLFRFQIFGHDPRDGVFIYGNNTGRSRVRLGRLSAGFHALRLKLHDLNLMPGMYKCSVGIWPDEEAEDAYDVNHGRYFFTVRGDPVSSLARIPSTWIVEGSASDPAPEVTRLASELLLEDLDGAPAARTYTKDAVVARGRVEAAAGGVSLMAEVFSGEQLVFRTRRDGQLAAGAHEVHLSLDRLNLLSGDYTLHLILADETGDELDRASAALTVVSHNEDGGGLVYSPSSWALD